MKIRKNLVTRHLDAISATKQDTLRSISLSLKEEEELSSQTSNESNME
jgi:hypothetical protein